MNSNTSKTKIGSTTSTTSKKAVKKALTRFTPQIRSKQPSYNMIRGKLEYLPFKSVVRFGSTTEMGDEVRLGGRRVELNVPQAIRNSASKFLMKELFVQNNIKTPTYIKYNSELTYSQIIERLGKDVFVAKLNMGSRGEGMSLIRNESEYNTWNSTQANKTSYLLEAYFTGNREYRLHISSEGCFYTCRKVIKSDTPEGQRYFRNDSNSNWLIETNQNFDKPSNWNTIIAECVKALNVIGADILAFDVKVQSTNDSRGRRRENPDFFILECNSGPSLGDITAEKYIEEIPKVLKRKYNNLNR
jgi:hypothetical protein